MKHPASADLTPFDYGIWGFVESRSCTKPHSNVTSLKASVKKEWTLVSEEFVKNTCAAFQTRLNKMIESDGDYIEV